MILSILFYLERTALISLTDSVQISQNTFFLKKSAGCFLKAFQVFSFIF